MASSIVTEVIDTSIFMMTARSFQPRLHKTKERKEIFPLVFFYSRGRAAIRAQKVQVREKERKRERDRTPSRNHARKRFPSLRRLAAGCAGGGSGRTRGGGETVRGIDGEGPVRSRRTGLWPCVFSRISRDIVEHRESRESENDPPSGGPLNSARVTRRDSFRKRTGRVRVAEVVNGVAIDSTQLRLCTVFVRARAWPCVAERSRWDRGRFQAARGASVERARNSYRRSLITAWTDNCCSAPRLRGGHCDGRNEATVNGTARGERAHRACVCRKIWRGLREWGHGYVAETKERKRERESERGKRIRGTCVSVTRRDC